MKNRFLIGEMSKLHKVPVKTLRYYDEIGLFQPYEVDEKSGYRYYSIEQFERLNTIKYLKTLGISLKEIMKLLEVRSLDNFLDLLQKEKSATEEKIEELQRIKEQFEYRISEVKKVRDISEIGVTRIESLPKRRVLRLYENIKTVDDIEINLRKLENSSQNESTIMVGNVLLTVSFDNLRCGNYHEYNSIEILLHESLYDSFHGIQNSYVEEVPSGYYACIYYRGNDHKESPRFYDILKRDIESKGFSIAGDSMERVIIDQYISKDEDEYLTEIQIPVEKDKNK